MIIEFLMHRLLDMAYCEDYNQILDKRADFNLNVIRTVCLYFFKVMAFSKKDLSFRRKQHYISVHLEDYFPFKNVGAKKKEN
ncbi:transposase [Streptococcus mutans SF1]|nr:transposase [Streptococcus mutans SF1]EMC20959.1 transposase [Streptococcus mutans SF14]